MISCYARLILLGVCSVLWYGVGGVSVVVLIFCGELTNPPLNVLEICGDLLQFDLASTTARRIQDAVLPPYAIVFALMRVVVGPAVALHMVWSVLLRFSCHNLLTSVLIGSFSSTGEGRPSHSGGDWCGVCSAWLFRSGPGPQSTPLCRRRSHPLPKRSLASNDSYLTTKHRHWEKTCIERWMVLTHTRLALHTRYTDDTGFLTLACLLFVTGFLS